MSAYSISQGASQWEPAIPLKKHLAIEIFGRYSFLITSGSSARKYLPS
jgi:hypothetical protein